MYRLLLNSRVYFKFPAGWRIKLRSKLQHEAQQIRALKTTLVVEAHLLVRIVSRTGNSVNSRCGNSLRVDGTKTVEWKNSAAFIAISSKRMQQFPSRPRTRLANILWAKPSSLRAKGMNRGKSRKFGRGSFLRVGIIERVESQSSVAFTELTLEVSFETSNQLKNFSWVKASSYLRVCIVFDSAKSENPFGAWLCVFKNWVSYLS